MGNEHGFVRDTVKKLAVVAGLLLATLAAGCSEKGQLVLGIATDLPAREQLNTVTLEVHRRGEAALLLPLYTWDLSGLPARDFRLPGSFNFFSQGSDAPELDVTIRGLLQLPDQQEAKLVVERRAVLAIQPEHDLFVRLSLVARCGTIGCPSSLSCVEGVCRPKRIDASLLPAYHPSLIEEISCDSGTTFIDTSTHVPLTMGAGCGAGSICREGTCLVDPSTLPLVDGKPFLGGETELFSTNVAPGAFFPVGALDAARFGATATTLKDGRVLVVGGFDTIFAGVADDGTAKPVPGAVVYEADRARYRRLPDPPVALGGHTATLLADDTVLFVGSSGGQPAAFVFDPNNDTFSPVGAPVAARVFHTASLLPGGRVLIVGGASSTKPPYAPWPSAEQFDPTSRTFKPTTGMPTLARVFHSATTLGDGRVLILGGYDGSSTATAVASTEIYRPATNDFLADGMMPIVRARHTATALPDGSVLVIGGEQQPSMPALTAVDQAVLGATTTWKPSGIPIPGSGKASHRALVLPDGRVLVVDGAVVANRTQISGGGTAFIYDATAQKIVGLPNSASKRFGGFVAMLANGDVLYGGGVVETQPPVDGGMSIDAGPPDMTDLYCNPVGNTSDGCSTEKPRCSVAGEAAYGPRVISMLAPTCVSTGTLSLGDVCTAGTQTNVTDDCSNGSVCARDTDNVLRCQEVCRNDTDCMNSRTRCSLVFTGPGRESLGLCLPACALEDLAGCTDFPGTTCRLTPNVPAAGNVTHAHGACLQSGMLPNMQPCTQMSFDTDCSNQTICVAGFCRIQCTPAFPNCTPCMRLIASDPDINGYCDDTAGTPDMSL